MDTPGCNISVEKYMMQKSVSPKKGAILLPNPLPPFLVDKEGDFLKVSGYKRNIEQTFRVAADSDVKAESAKKD